MQVSITTGFAKKFLQTTRNKKKKHWQIMKHWQALANNEISHEDFMTIINEEKKY